VTGRAYFVEHVPNIDPYAGTALYQSIGEVGRINPLRGQRRDYDVVAGVTTNYRLEISAYVGLIFFIIELNESA